MTAFGFLVKRSLYFLWNKLNVTKLPRDSCWRGIPANTRHWPNVGSILGHRLRRWPGIEPTLYEWLCLPVSGSVFWVSSLEVNRDNFRRQNLTSKVNPRPLRVKIFLTAIDIGIQVKREQLTRSFMMISNRENPLDSMVHAKII